jgi:predicted transcriptional regulator
MSTTTLPRQSEDLRALRRAAGLSQVDVAVRAGCSPSFVGQVEAGYRPVRSHLVERIRAVLTDGSEMGAAA